MTFAQILNMCAYGFFFLFKSYVPWDIVVFDILTSTQKLLMV